jgi:hypothetical protein
MLFIHRVPPGACAVLLAFLSFVILRVQGVHGQSSKTHSCLLCPRLFQLCLNVCHHRMQTISLQLHIQNFIPFRFFFSGLDHHHNHHHTAIAIIIIVVIIIVIIIITVLLLKAIDTK